MKVGRLLLFPCLTALFLSIVVCDQATKYLAVVHLTRAFEHHGWTTTADRLKGFVSLENLDNWPRVPGKRDHRLPPKALIPGFWNFKYVENPGAAWGFLADADERFRIPFFHVVSLIALALVGWFFHHVPRDQHRLRVALTLIVGGAVGNYIDRLLHGYVIDFIDWHVGGRHFPTFNVADSALTVGVSLLLLDMIITTIRERQQLKQRSTETLRQTSHPQEAETSKSSTATP